MADSYVSDPRGDQFATDFDGTGHTPKIIGPRGALTDRGTTITVGGTSQTLAAANATRRFLLIVNPPTETETLYVNFTSAAAANQTSVPLSPGGSMLMQSPGLVSNELVTVVAATTGHTVACKEG